MEKEKRFMGETFAEENVKPELPPDARARDVADKAEDINIDDKKAPTTTTTRTTTTTEDGNAESGNAQPEHEYISGFRLFLVITAVTLVVFLMMLDMSIIVTVCSTISQRPRSALLKKP
jgi:hypothetical protein